MCDFWTTLLSLWCKSPVCVISATVCLRHSTAGRLRLPCLCVSVEGFVPWSSGHWPLTGAAWRPSERLLSCCWHCCWTWRRLSAEKSWELLNVGGHDWAEINPNCSKPWTRLGNIGHSSPRPLCASKPFYWAVGMSIKKKYSEFPAPCIHCSLLWVSSRAEQVGVLWPSGGGWTATAQWLTTTWLNLHQFVTVLIETCLYVSARGCHGTQMQCSDACGAQTTENLYLSTSAVTKWKYYLTTSKPCALYA